VVKPTVGMSKGKHKLRRCQLARQPDGNTVDRPLTLHLHPVSATSSDIWPICPLRDYPLEVGKREPGLRELDIDGLIDEFQTRIMALE
jgi:hypothetical protein